jgi:hypothetical protein
MSDIISQNIIINNEDLLDIQPQYIFNLYRKIDFVLFLNIFILVGIKICFLEGVPFKLLQFLDNEIIFSGIVKLGQILFLFYIIDLIWFEYRKLVDQKKIDVGSYLLELHLIDKKISLNTVAFEFFKGSFILPFCAFTKSQQSKYFILLQQKTVTYPEWIFLKKDAITFADFQRLEEAIPCLQGLSVDPQQFKQELHTHES